MDGSYIHRNNSRNYLKKFYILVILSVNISIERNKSLVIVPNGQRSVLNKVPLKMADICVGCSEKKITKIKSAFVG
jgi:hypothetical protein